MPKTWNAETQVSLTELMCGACGVVFAIPTPMYNEAMEHGPKFKGWYCPNGHARVFSKSNSEELREEYERKLAEKERHAEWLAKRQREAQSRADHEARRAAAYKGQTTRLKNRARAGMCPCCNRHFTNLERHMETKHPEFAAAEGESGKVGGG